jgi:hypothetical protein
VLTVPIIALTVRDKTTNAPPTTDAKPDASKDMPSNLEQKEANDQEGVFVVKNGKTRFVPVKIGIAGKEHFEVLSGVNEKDSVVAGPYEVIRTLESDKAVRPMPATTPGMPGATPVKKEGN